MHSIPVSLGKRRALLVAALSHLAAVALLLAVGPLLGLGWSYLAGCLLVAVLLAWSHVDIARRGLQTVGMRFMTVNGVVGLIYGVVAIVAVLLS
jgi:4-hydroxybenzoate polyprenyltransferase